MRQSYSSVPLRFLICTLIILTCSCADKAQKIVDNAINTHGGETFESFFLEFNFRDRHYTAARDGGNFTYTREFRDSTGNIKDVLNNEGFTRYLNDNVVDLPNERKEAFKSSVNSVIYFMLLPFGLNDDPVKKEWVGESTIRGESYQVIRVTFDEHDGGDPDDIFMYWFHAEKNTMDYFAYSYKTDGGGIRFREAINSRRVGGLLLQDYINYKPEDENIPIDSLQPMFIAGDLKKLSEIKLENLSVSEYKKTVSSNK